MDYIFVDLSFVLHYMNQLIILSLKSYLSMKKFKLAILQTKCTTNKEQNIQIIAKALTEAGNNGAQVSVLGQICNSPYVKTYIQEFAEDFSDSPTLKAIKEASAQHKMYTIGSIARRANEKLFNTAFVINPKGELQEQYDKTHLFDINIPGKITYIESETFSPGDKMCVFDTEYCRMGLGICYDLRFAQFGLLMAKKGARVLLYPGSFNQTTGPVHWELLLRGRALDTQCFTIGVSVAQPKDTPEIYQAWGHSTLVDPYGKVLVGLDQNPHIAYYDVDPEYTDQIREQIPITKQKRTDLYTIEQKI